jgi:hypothetical protein
VKNTHWQGRDRGRRDFPNILRVPGPHKIPLIAHAQKGGADAVAVVEFLRTLASCVIERGNHRQSVENPHPDTQLFL